MQTYYYEYRDSRKAGTVQANTDEEALALVRDKNLLVLYKESDSIDGRPFTETEIVNACLLVKR
jgi:hypothetical protein